MHRQNRKEPLAGWARSEPFGKSPPGAVPGRKLEDEYCANLANSYIIRTVALFKTVRPLSSIVTGVLTASAAFMGQRQLNYAGLSAGLAITALSMFGFAVNDILDYHLDRAAGIKRPVAAGELSRKSAMWLALVMLLAAFLFSLAAGPGKAILATISVLLLFYSPLKKRHPLLKDVYVAGLCCLPLYYGIAVGGRQCPWFSYAVLACFVLGREIWMDSDETQGDSTSGVQTIGVVLGSRETLWLGRGLMLLAAAALVAVTRGLIAVSICAASFLFLACVFAWPGLSQSRRIEWSRGPMLLGAMAIAWGCA